MRDLFSRCAADIPSACDQFYRAISPLFRRIAGRVARQYGGSQDVDDIVQDAFLKIATSKEKLCVSLPENEEGCKAYLSMLAANTARDWYRRERQRAATVPVDDNLTGLCELWGVAPDSHRQMLFNEIESSVVGEDKEKIVFRLYYRQGFSAREIAEIPHFGLTTKGVESLLLRISRQLRSKFTNAQGTAREQSLL